MQPNFLADVQSFEAKKLKSTETQVTTPSGKKYVERKKDDGEVVAEKVQEGSYGFCVDLTPDMIVGVAMNGLLVASQDVAQDLLTLRQHGVTHILNVAYGIANRFPEDFEYLNVKLLDTPEQDFMAHYATCEEFIDRGRATGRVLVHCNAGRSRSSSVALAYVMHKQRLPLGKALARLRETRPEVQPNEGFLAQLKSLEKKLEL